MTKKFIFTALLSACLAAVSAQNSNGPFHAYLYNSTYRVYLQINLYDKNVSVPGHELYGELPGYLGKKDYSFCWAITSCEVKNDHETELQLINDYGSEDLTATLTCENDSIFVLQQQKGSTLKVPHKGKWQKLPKTLTFKKK